MGRWHPTMIWERMTEPVWAYALEHHHNFLWWWWDTYTWHVRFYEKKGLKPVRKINGRAASAAEAIERAKAAAEIDPQERVLSVREAS